MKSTCVLIAFWSLAFSSSLFAQTDPPFGKCTIEELSMTVYGRDREAEAVILSDIGNSIFTYNDVKGFLIIFERTTRIKILSKAGLEYANVSIPYFVDKDDWEKVYDVEGFTYNLENNVVTTSEFDDKNVFTEKTEDKWHHKKFAMPDVKVGSVIEYRYKVISPYFFNFRDWDFQSRIPTVYSEYTARMIPPYEYTYVVQGIKKFDHFENYADFHSKRVGLLEYKDNIFVMGLKNVPAFRDEEYITSIRDYIIRIDFQLSVIHHLSGAEVRVVTTWPGLIREMMKETDFGLYLKSASRSAGDILATFSLPADDKEKVKALYMYTKENFNWNGVTSKYPSQTIKEFLKTKTGNTADINLFLFSLIDAAGIQAFPILISTREHGKIRMEVPFQQYLNHVIVAAQIDSQKIFMDASEPLASFGMLPSRCINDNGLIFNSE